MDMEKKTYQKRMPSHREQRSPRRSLANGSGSLKTPGVSSEEMKAIARLLEESPVKTADPKQEPVSEEAQIETETDSVKKGENEEKNETAPELIQENQEAKIEDPDEPKPETAQDEEKNEAPQDEAKNETPQEESEKEDKEPKAETPEAGTGEKKTPFGKKAAKWIKEHKLVVSILITAILIVIVLIALIVVPSNNTAVENNNYMDQIRNQEIKVNDVDAIDDFFTNYYTALSSGNTTALESMFDDPTKVQITTEISTIVNKYDNIQVYVTPGINEGDIVAFVYNDIHFANIDAIAPSVDSFYLVYNEDEAALKICADMYTDQQILKYMNLVSYRDPIRTLLSDTNNSLSEALAGNKDLNNLYILMQSMAESADNTDMEIKETTAAEEAESETETQTTEK